MMFRDMQNINKNEFLYTGTEFLRETMTPARMAIKELHNFNQDYDKYLSNFAQFQIFDAYCQIFERLTRKYPKQQFNIKEVAINKKIIKVKEEVLLKKSFCDLIHFKKSSDIKLPKMLVVAPMSGHYATLCKGTVEGLLPHYDVYITDWKNARDVPLKEGSFDLHDFINYCIEFFDNLGPNLNVMAICQPSPPVVAAISIMSAEKMKNIPKSMILIGGPIDTRQNPTDVNKYAAKKSMSWFKNNVITRVPINYDGYMRKVYPGFVQLSGFVTMNMFRHLEQHINLFENLSYNEHDLVDKHVKFYDEYFSVMDLTEEYYLQTIESVFKSHSLAKGEMVSRGRKIDLNSITKTSILVLEGERDDITGIGQTKAILNLCKMVPKENKHYSLQNGVGHFGLFSGSKFLSNIVPEIVKFTG